MTAPTFGFPRMHKERGERRDFLPPLIGAMAALGCPVVIEHGLGSRMGYRDADYTATSPRVQVGDAAAAFGQDVVVVLRSPDEQFHLLRRGATLISMLHFPTRPARVGRLLELGIDALSLDSIEKDEGTRLVENLHAVGWNGLYVAFGALAAQWPRLFDVRRPPVRVVVLGAGSVAKHAVEAATKYGSLRRNSVYSNRGLPGVEVVVVGRNLTGNELHMRALFRATDVLVDATQRLDASRPIVPNEWLGDLPRHAVVCDLVADPYLLDGDPPTVRGIEGIPMGNLDRWTFLPGDGSWTDSIPAGIPTRHRRTVVSCYSWPGVRPEACMRRYAAQLLPLLETLVRRGGPAGLRSTGDPWERALSRARLLDRVRQPAMAERRAGSPFAVAS